MSLATHLLATAPLIALLACVVVHVLASRFLITTAHHHTAATGVAGGLVVAIGITVATLRLIPGLPSADRGALAGVSLLTYFALAYFYVFGFYNLGESSRRVRLLIELHSAGARGMTRAEILAAYNARMIIAARLHRLLVSGQIVQRGGRYVVGEPLMLMLAKSLVLLKRLYLGAPSEFGDAKPHPLQGHHDRAGQAAPLSFHSSGRVSSARMDGTNRAQP
jgi:hypothetical protein